MNNFSLFFGHIRTIQVFYQIGLATNKKSLTDIAKELGFHHQRISKSFIKLEKLGLIEKGALNKREKFATPTFKGKKIFNEIKGIFEVVKNEL